MSQARAPNDGALTGADQQFDRLELLPYVDPGAALEVAGEAIARALEQGREDLWQRARLVQAEALMRRGASAEGARTAREVVAWATLRGHRHLIARSHRLLSLFFFRVGDCSQSLEHAVRAVEHEDDSTPWRIRADHLTTLAVALGGTGAFVPAREKLLAAERLAVQHDDPALRLAVLNNLAYTEHLAGDPSAAMTAAERMLAVAASRGTPLELTFLHTVATAQLGLARHAEAEATLERGLADLGGDDVADPDAVPEALLTLAAAQRSQGRTEQAWESLERCAALCRRSRLSSISVQVLRERAELLAASGRYREAYEQLQEFHEEHVRLFSTEREARAATLHAVYESEEARKDVDRFRQLSLHDPLTGAYNRRYLEELTPSLLAAARDDGAPLSLALLDVDHFKQVNDTLSHEVGDQLLRALADVLAGVTDAGAFSARLGGDEFVLVLPGVDVPQAVRLCRQVQRRTAELDGATPFTTSIGVAGTSAERTTLTDLLAQADANLYRAKRAGRAQVVGPDVES